MFARDKTLWRAQKWSSSNPACKLLQVSLFEGRVARLSISKTDQKGDCSTSVLSFFCEELQCLFSKEVDSAKTKLCGSLPAVFQLEQECIFFFQCLATLQLTPETCLGLVFRFFRRWKNSQLSDVKMRFFACGSPSAKDLTRSEHMCHKKHPMAFVVLFVLKDD